MAEWFTNEDEDQLTWNRRLNNLNLRFLGLRFRHPGLAICRSCRPRPPTANGQTLTLRMRRHGRHEMHAAALDIKKQQGVERRIDRPAFFAPEEFSAPTGPPIFGEVPNEGHLPLFSIVDL